MVLLSQKITHMRQKLTALVEQAARVGLKINASKTKEMRIWSPANTGNINCVGQVLEQVSASAAFSPPPAALRKMLRPSAGSHRLHSGCVPEQFKLANVIPGQKKDTVTFMNNYRPISLLSIFNKILEKLVYNRLITIIRLQNYLQDKTT